VPNDTRRSAGRLPPYLLADRDVMRPSASVRRCAVRWQYSRQTTTMACVDGKAMYAFLDFASQLIHGVSALFARGQ